MNLQQRIGALVRLGQYMTGDDLAWQAAKEKAERNNSWFTQPFIDQAVRTIATQFLDHHKLADFVLQYSIPDTAAAPVTVGLVMAGNIPLVGFHDLMCVFLSGHRAMVKASSKDEILITHLVNRMQEWYPEASEWLSFATMLKGCDAYIATGSNNSARYFDFYFGKYPHIIRRNRTSVAILTGREQAGDLEKLADDVMLYFGLGCRNVTKVYVPQDYDFVPLLAGFKKYADLANHNKYRNNYDYQLALHQLNQKYYMTDGVVLLSENAAVFSPISQLNYEWYTDRMQLEESLRSNTDIQCIAGKGFTPFGQAQCPALSDFADGADTMDFLLRLHLIN